MSNHTGIVPLWLTEDYMQEVLIKATDMPDTQLISMDCKPASAVGDNYLGEVLRILLKYQDDDDEKKLQIIAKITPETEFISTVSETVSVFEVEAIALTSLLPSFNKYLTKEYSFFPKCYLADFEKQTIFLEDLKASFYEMQTRANFFKKEQTILTVEALATMHACSLMAMQEDESLRDKFTASMWNGKMFTVHEKMIHNASAGISKFIDLYDLPDHHRDWIMNFSETAFEGIKKLAVDEDKLNVLLHGDCWMNNMLFRYNIDGDMDSIKLIDYQIVNYNHFSHDLIYLLFSSVSADILVNDIDEILEVYYLKLIEIAPDIPDISLERIKIEFEERIVFGAIILVLFRAMFCAETPVDMEAVLSGKLQDMGFGVEVFRSDIKATLPLFEAYGLITPS